MNIGKTTPLQLVTRNIHPNTQYINIWINKTIISNTGLKDPQPSETYKNKYILNKKAYNNRYTGLGNIHKLCINMYLYITKNTASLENYTSLLILKTHIISNVFWKTTVYSTTNQKLWFLNSYLHKSDLIWNDGFLLDFLQKKSLDLWIRKFVIYTGYIFSERVVFNSIIFVYNLLVVKTLSRLTVLYNNSVLNILLTLVYTLLSILTLVALTVIIM